MATIQPIAVKHEEKGQGIVVDRLAHYDTEKGGFLVQLGVAFYDHPVPAVHYHSPEELEQLAVLDYPSDDMEDGDEGEEEEEEEGDPA